MPHKAFIESAKGKRTPTGSCASSTMREATDEEIARFNSKPCDHSAQDLLVYDISGFLYDFRSCAVCHAPIGLV